MEAERRGAESRERLSSNDLYGISEELVGAFRWPDRDEAAWFVLTGEVPRVRPLDARWVPEGDPSDPRWRARLTISPWVPAEEVSRTYRRMQKQVLEGRNRLATPKTLGVARFVMEQTRLNGGTRPQWETLRQHWNRENPSPGNQFGAPEHPRQYFARGERAISNSVGSWRRDDKSGG